MFDTDKQILENNIYGVDINDESVEISKLSLWLRTAQKGRVLSDLTNNIKCGNSLIDDPEIAGEKAFNWNVEFKEIMDNGGFDVVIGNPPYFNIQTLGAGSKVAQWIQNEYSEIWQDKSDILFYFIYKALKLSKSEIGFIISNAFLFSDKAQKLRNYLIKDNRLCKIINFEKYLVFADASITSCMIIFNKYCNNKQAIVLKNKNYTVKQITSYIENPQNIVNVKFNENSVFALVNDQIDKLNIKIDKTHKKLIDVCYMGKGMETAANNVFLFNEFPSQFPKEFIKKRLVAENIDKYLLKPSDTYILYYENIDEFEFLPENIKDYLAANYDFLINRATVKNEGRAWWRFSRPMHKNYYHLNKIWCSYRSKNNAFYLDESSDYIGFTNTTVIFDTNPNYSLKYILALLNSKLIYFRYKTIAKQTGGGVFEFVPNAVGKIPIPICNNQQPFIKKADLMLSLNKEFHFEKQNFINSLKDHKKLNKITKHLEDFNKIEFSDLIEEIGKQKARFTLGMETNEWREYFNITKQKVNELQNKINQTDKEIDKMVYELYNLTPEEIEIVENAASN